MSLLSEALASTGKSIKPEVVGETITGTITGVEVTQYTDFESRKPQFWDDGKPKQQIVVELDVHGSEDEGAVYIKNWGGQKKALLEAIAATGLDADAALAPGNQFSITFTGETPNEKNPRLNAIKNYSYLIQPRANTAGALTEATPAAPAQAGSAYDPWEAQAQAQATPAPAATPAMPAPTVPTPAPAAAPAPAGAGASIPALIAAGLTDEQITAATGVDAATIAVLRQQA